ncbi:MAG TPA: 2-C-methyl-D-erythritol 4-phosphate cytidylyltransferase [Candidatus Binataceae bacterium]|nr:2-C-methyl-D-erythritol 4-phosphate cytidylyltransferase [Candidatus Binataceae bacterium]
MKASAIVVAAGSGLRLGMAQPKALVPLGRDPILYYCLRTLAQVAQISELIISAPPTHLAAVGELAQRAAARLIPTVVSGGAQRQDSVRCAIQRLSPDAELVVIHDAARPFASATLFEACLNAAARVGASLACVPVADTLKEAEGSFVRATRSRQALYQAQTPQAFTRSVLLAAHARAGGDSATDDALLAEQIGQRVEIVMGSPLNFKITTAEDLRLAQALLAGDPELAARFSGADFQT